MSDELRVLRPDRRQIFLDTVDLESQLPEDHMARIVWDFVETLDISPLERGIKSREGHPGRPTPDRRLYMALWLYATLDGVGAARELDRQCRMHTAYRWLCGGVPVNYHDLADFRVEAGEFLDELLSGSVAALVAQGLVGLDCLAVDSVRVRASAGSNSFRREESLTRLYEAAQTKVAALRAEIEADPGAASKRLQARQVRARSERAAAVSAAKAALETIKAERVKEAEKQRRKTVRGNPPRASTTDSQARVMKCDGGFRPAYNFQIRTDVESGIVLGLAVTNCASDRGLLTPAVEDIERRYRTRPKQVLADSGYDAKDDIEHLYSQAAGAIDVFCPLPRVEGQTGQPDAAARRRPRRHCLARAHEQRGWTQVLSKAFCHRASARRHAQPRAHQARGPRHDEGESRRSVARGDLQFPADTLSPQDCRASTAGSRLGDHPGAHTQPGSIPLRPAPKTLVPRGR